jgi:lysophospholipase L1-like esterase
VLLCHQPFSDPSVRELCAEERDLHELGAARRMVGRALREYVQSRWAEYGRRLAAECEAMSARFVDLHGATFAGWSFIDELHMTDHGYRRAAELVWDGLR